MRSVDPGPGNGSENDTEEIPGRKRPYIAKNQMLARERFNNCDEQMKAPAGFAGFGGRPSFEDDEYDKDRDRARSKKIISLNS